MVINPAPSESIREAAAEWFARMRRPDAARFKHDFEAWLAESSDHRSAYNRIAETFSLGKNLVSDLGLEPVRGEPQRRGARRGELVFVACSILLGCGFAAALWNERFGASDQKHAAASLAPASRVELVTREGQLRSIRLSDGSWVTLDTNSRVTAIITAEARTLQLHMGRARFRVAHDGRPFIVSAGAGSVIARGTVFDVALREGGEVSVELLQGSVDVLTRSAARSDAPVLRRQKLVPGRATIVSLAKPASPVTQVSEDGWIHAPIDFDNARIADVIAQANFNAPRPVRIEGVGIGDLRMSGTFRISDTRQLAMRIANLFDLNADDRDGSVILLRRRSGL
jgi:transmembrane sensor